MIFGWAQGRGHWIGPVIGIVIFMYGVYNVSTTNFKSGICKRRLIDW